jgi:hypothetical protein
MNENLICGSCGEMKPDVSDLNEWRLYDPPLLCCNGCYAKVIHQRGLMEGIGMFGFITVMMVFVILLFALIFLVVI